MEQWRKRGIIVVSAITLLVILVMVPLGFYAVWEPQTQVGYVLFRASYDRASSKTGVLRGFEGSLREYNGGYIPEQADKFLCSKLQASTSEEEFTAILDFYALRSGGREGRYIYLVSAPTKERISRSITSSLDGYTPDQAARALILLEVLRRGESIGKANFGPAKGYPKDYSSWWQRTGLPEVKTRFRQWLESYPTWQQREKHDPLEHSFVQLSAP